jgi:O-antigen/teichoic acid export membrane protein
MTAYSKVSRALGWSAIDMLIRHGLNFVVLIILARILSPSDFGLVAMLALFVAVAGLLIDSGFSQALIQKREISLIDESTVFFFTIIVGVVAALVLCALAPWIANFYGQPVLKQMTYWMALNLLLNTFASIHTTLLTRELDFKTLAKTSIVSAVVSGGCAIFLAANGWGVWSLVGQILIATVSSVLLLWTLHPWRPAWVFHFASLRSFFRFGGFLLWTGVLNALYTNLYALLIGKLHSVQDVGYYSQAQRIQLLPVNILTNIVGRVAFPVFASVAEDKVRLKKGMSRALTSVMFINIPLMIAILVLGVPLIVTLFGVKWLPSAPILQVLAVVGLMWPLHSLNINVLKAQGHSALNARIQLIKLSVAIILLLLTSPYGLLAIAYGQVAASLVAFFINAYYSGRLLNYGWLEQLRDITPYFAAGLLMGVVDEIAFRLMDDLPIQIGLAAAAILGASAYFMVCYMAKLEAPLYLLSVLQRKKAE